VLSNAYALNAATAPGSASSKLQQQPTAHLRVLQLSGNALGATGLQQLLAGLAAASAGANASLLGQLQVLELGCNALGDAGAAVLAQHCQQLSSLQLLGLSGNGIGAEGARALFGCLSGSSSSSSGSSSSSSNTSSSGRSFSRGGICRPNAVVGCTVAAEQGQLLPALRVLQLGGNFLGDAGTVALAAALPGLRQLRQLELQDNYSIGEAKERTSTTPVR
jgi:Ran GTPase-activating protein (RanGAP) involved in mRNA processing and transport